MSEGHVEPRVRQPKDHGALLEQLRTNNDGPFSTKAEALVFAAAVGWSKKQRRPFTEYLEPIRYHVVARSGTVESFISALAVLEHPDDPQILSDERVQDRITVFEEYANGGLVELQSKINTGRGTVREVLAEFVRAMNRPVADDDLPAALGNLMPGTWS